ncbi:hypothetical protein ZIOFF_050917 [Zingiber officinale]|uniref:Retrovirus-related Pol polyprotein from transposon TNT 1-94-like beta-barrel domain-containing protein n=1 Tax=Zingiber officinale TaxID=94328 RepID=A0A8J5FSE4_ZINOF|nr:hypothetical protein ZIOFF_050917 [Zingiber officinale]
METFLHSKEYWSLVETGIPVTVEGVELTEAQGKLFANQKLKDLKEWFSDLDEEFRTSVKLGNNSTMTVMGKGNIRLQIVGATQVITDVFYIPELKNNLLSIGQLQEKGVSILIQHGICKIYHPEKGLIMQTAMSANRIFMASPTELHLQAAKRVLTYLKGTVDLGVFYQNEGNGELMAYTDSDYAGDTNDRKSTSGYVFLLSGGVVGLDEEGIGETQSFSRQVYGIVELKHCITQDQVADIMTKPLKLDVFLKLRELMGVRVALSFLNVFKHHVVLLLLVHISSDFGCEVDAISFEMHFVVY